MHSLITRARAIFNPSTLTTNRLPQSSSHWMSYQFPDLLHSHFIQNETIDIALVFFSKRYIDQSLCLLYELFELFFPISNHKIIPLDILLSCVQTFTNWILGYESHIALSIIVQEIYTQRIRFRRKIYFVTRVAIQNRPSYWHECEPGVGRWFLYPNYL